MIASSSNETNWWVLVGREENWDYAIQGTTGIWGVRDTSSLKSQWDSLQKEDYVLFYVTSPIKGIVGYGQIESKNKQNTPIWPDERRENKVIYPWRFYFDIKHLLPVERWKIDKLKIERIPFQAGLSRIANPETIKRITKTLKEKWEEELEIPSALKEKPKEKETAVSLHDRIKEMIYEIGKGQKFISEKETSLDGERLDVTWKRVMRGVPTKVFEVQISGNIYQALAKLKHSFDLWNSEPYIIIQKEDREKVDKLLSGTFHEIRDITKVITTDKIEDFYSILKKSIELKKELEL